MAGGRGLVRAIEGFYDPESTRPSIRFVELRGGTEGTGEGA
jgi:hypothetical protein